MNRKHYVIAFLVLAALAGTVGARTWHQVFRNVLVRGYLKVQDTIELDGTDQSVSFSVPLTTDDVTNTANFSFTTARDDANFTVILEPTVDVTVYAVSKATDGVTITYQRQVSGLQADTVRGLVIPY